MGSLRMNGFADRQSTGARRAFTLVDVMVSIAVIALLVGILLPSLKMVHETSQRVVCASNLRQVGLGIHMYSTDNDAWLPFSSFASGNGDYWNTDPLYLRVDARSRGYDVMVWDGLGVMFDQSYLNDGQIFYCPSHTGRHTFEAYADQFAGADGEILANYQYRGEGPDLTGHPQQRLDFIENNASLVSDGFREVADINHQQGMNVLRAGMSVGWHHVDREILLDMASQAGDGSDEPDWEERWRLLDLPASGSGFWDDLFN